MSSKAPYAALALLPSLLLGASQASGGISLAADEAPVDPPWKQPANISVVREKGKNTVTADLVLKYRSEEQFSTNEKFAANGAYAFGVYLHRDNTPDASKNDRGVQASYSGLLVPNWSNASAVASLGYAIKASTGKGLVEIEPTPGTKSLVDKTKNRIVIALGGYIQPATKPGDGSPQLGVMPGILFFDGGPSLYMDESRGHGVAGTGRITGAAFKLGLNYAPLGLEPKPLAQNLAVVPTIRIAAQTQHDLSASDARTKANRRLYSVDFALLFAKPDDSVKTLVPTLTLSRSVGADVLTGRKQSAKTELTFGVTY